MKVYKVPFDVKREEKIFGGYLSLRQVIYLMMSASSLIVFTIPINIIIKITISSLFTIFFLLCAFLKINEQNFDMLFFYATKYIYRKKKFIYERCSH